MSELKDYIERIERLEEEKKGVSADINEIYSEAAGDGFDKKVMRQIIALRKMSKPDQTETEFLREEYKKQLGIE